MPKESIGVVHQLIVNVAILFYALIKILLNRYKRIFNSMISSLNEPGEGVEPPFAALQAAA